MTDKWQETNKTDENKDEMEPMKSWQTNRTEFTKDSNTQLNITI